MSRKLLILATSVILVFLFFVQSKAQSAATSAIQVTVHATTPGIRIPTNFMGLSFTDTSIADPRNLFSPTKTTFVNLLKSLGPGVIRISGDEHTWSSSGDEAVAENDLNAASSVVLTPSKVDPLFAMAKAAGWQVIYGINFRSYYVTGSSTYLNMAVSEAAYLYAKEGSTLLAYEVGNEPTSYNVLTNEPVINFTNYVTKYSTYVQKIRAKAPNAKFTGPSVYQSFPFNSTFADKYFSGFLTNSMIKGKVAISTMHMYPASTRNPNQELTIDQLLTKDIDTRTDTYVKGYVARAKAAAVPLRFTEMNSSSQGGNKASSSFAASLWGANTLFMMAKDGVAGVNFSGGGCGGYSAIGFCGSEYHKFGLYYGMLFFHNAAKGRIVPVDMSTTMNITSYATLADDGSLRVAIINKEMDLTKNVTFNISLDKNYAHAKIMRLSAPTLDDTGEHITLATTVLAASEDENPGTPADTSIDSSAASDGSVSIENISGSATNYSVTMRNGSALVVIFYN